MTYADRWLLPDGIEEILPDEARPIDLLRRRLVELYRTWGYDMVIPPLLEYTDSLLIGLGRDVDLLTFKVTDQLTGRTLGLRADITPQTARMDAHSFKREGANRLCYAGHVVHTKPKNPLATRTPIQAGVEFYGESGLAADVEVVSLLLESLRAAGLPKLHIDLGHVGIYSALIAKAEVSEAQKDLFFAMLQRKAVAEIEAWVSENITDAAIAKVLLALPGLAGARDILDKARDLFAAVSSEAVNAVDELASVAEVIQTRYPEAELYFDLGELRGYHYLTGLVFAAFAPGYGNPIASGGRYDHIGEVFGRSRPATGFAVDITALSKLGLLSAPQSGLVGFVDDGSAEQWRKVAELRAAGERVVSATSREEFAALGCDQVLEKQGDTFQVSSL
ncbi:ATP phosphoribosyltransferase regulatory subunit [Gilvimarinus sp. SDUM040013]|uniref:ATP phosphoribosyltransferase regulatory subunit n=1 Tax=Gilvimarinus gilvus TaxID=3058038 RepID=A0ABU4RVT3_9GAMM|nr:ATP phosphoribosyltransferase regulatory subunit [Gilvimarinus sp. SDUM040013]MDO3387294.1 ATP phosphoribosyltransferase regulatory subunit [Gilvimarinus sp. SDUM040013]MDX6848983.1 ATP phosphoribosyltransferase regulatory subunit [Gilvimarinus sp. SDUM040013]